MKRKQKRSQARIHIKNQINRRVIIRRGFCGWWWVKDSSKIWYQMVFYCLSLEYSSSKYVGQSCVIFIHCCTTLTMVRCHLQEKLIPTLQIVNMSNRVWYVRQNYLYHNTFPLNLVEAGFFDQRRFHSSLILEYYNNHFHSNIIYIFLHIYYIQLMGNWLILSFLSYILLKVFLDLRHSIYFYMKGKCTIFEPCTSA